MARERAQIGKRLRFEIFKRDGFKCRYWLARYRREELGEEGED